MVLIFGNVFCDFGCINVYCKIWINR